MAAVTIRNIPDNIHKAIKARAKANGRSAEAEVRVLLGKEYSATAPSKSFGEVIDELREKFGGGLDIPVVPRSKDPIEPADFE